MIAGAVVAASSLLWTWMFLSQVPTNPFISESEMIAVLIGLCIFAVVGGLLLIGVHMLNQQRLQTQPAQASFSNAAAVSA